MNKRSLVIVFGLTIIFFFVNQWFSTKNEKQKIKNQTEKQILLSKELEKKEEGIALRTAPLTSLPLVKLYSDASNKEFLTWAVKDNNQYLTVGFETPLPPEVYSNSKNTKSEKIFLRIEGKNLGDPAVYSTDTKELLVTVKLPHTQRIDLQLVNLSATEEPQVVLATFENNHLYFPGNAPSGDSIALYKMEGEYLPVGFYNATHKRFEPIHSFSALNHIASYKEGTIKDTPQTEEIFYVLENDYQQLVFTNIGGAIAEINLKLKSNDAEKSVVLPIGFDRDIEKNHPKNNRFPNNPYYIATDDSSSPKLMQPEIGSYTPLIRRSLEKGPYNEAKEAPQKFYALSTVSDYPESSHLSYKLKRLEKNLIQLEALEQNRRITKTYYFRDDIDAPYTLELDIRVEGDSRGLWLTSGVPEVELISGSPAPIIKYRTTQNYKSVIDKISLPKQTFTYSAMQPDWVCNSNGFLGIILDPLTDTAPGFKANNIPGEIDPTRLTIIDGQYDVYPANKYPGYEVLLPLKQTSKEMKFRIFAGPFDNKILKTVDRAFSNEITGYNPNYIASQSFHGWFSFISEPFSKFLFLVMNFFHKLTGSWGFSIILLTIVLRLMMYPLNAWSIKSNVRMQAVAPEVSKIQKKHKKDPKRGQIETMQLYKEKGVNPFTGCIPLLIQLPFLIGMFDLLKSTFELRGVSFIPGWINNLTAPDVLFSWNYPLIFFGNEFHLLPFILGGMMFLQQKISQTKHDPASMTDQQKQQQKMGSMMTIVFTFLFYKFPSGLNLYWISSTGLQILQHWYTSKKFGGKNVNVQIRKTK